MVQHWHSLDDATPLESPHLWLSMILDSIEPRLSPMKHSEHVELEGEVASLILPRLLFWSRVWAVYTASVQERGLFGRGCRIFESSPLVTRLFPHLIAARSKVNVTAFGMLKMRSWEQIEGQLYRPNNVLIQRWTFKKCMPSTSQFVLARKPNVIFSLCLIPV